MCTLHPPFYLLFRWDSRLPLDLQAEEGTGYNDVSNLEDCVQEYHHRLKLACEVVREPAEKASQGRKMTYDRKYKEALIRPGDSVFIHNHKP